jgi:hypothetical protein
MEIILGILALMGGTIFVLLKQVGKLSSDKKLNDIKVADTKLEEKQAQVQEVKSKLQDELKKVDEQKAAELSDNDIEKHWGDYKK